MRLSFIPGYIFSMGLDLGKKKKKEEGTKASSLIMKPADGQLGQYPRTPEAYPPLERESGHGSLMGLQSSWPRVDSSQSRPRDGQAARELWPAGHGLLS